MESCYIRANRSYWVEMKMLEIRLADLLTPRSTILLQKPIAPQLIKKFPVFYGTRKFITAFTPSLHLSLFGATSIQSTNPTYTLKKIHFSIFHPSKPRFSKWALKIMQDNKIIIEPYVLVLR